MPVIVSIASQVANGHVGNSAAVFALQRLGFEVWDVPTVLLPYHPGHGPGTRIETPADALAGLLGDLARHERLPEVAGILTGYMGNADQIGAVADFIGTARRSSPGLVYCCDPVIGDGGRLYVHPDVAKGVRDRLVPLSDMATPNAFELGWLTGAAETRSDTATLARLARTLAPKEVYATSAEPMMRGHAATLAVTEGERLLAEAPAAAKPPHGLGDLLAALLLAHRLSGLDLEQRLVRAVAAVHDMALRAQAMGRDEMPLAQAQDALTESRVTVQVRRFASLRSPAKRDAPPVVGVDGCPGGWLAVRMPADAPDKAELYFFEEFEALLVAFGDAAAIAVDMPIGLPDRRTGAGRACEVEARARLGARQSSVFSIPARGAVMAGDYAEACNVALETSDPPRKVSKQAFMLFPKIREIDLCWEDGMEGHLFECHPELAFWALNGGRPMALPKKVKSRNNPPGLDERARALEAAGFAPGFLVHGNTERMPGKARRDDLLDACVCAWSAARISRGEGIAFPEEPEFDGLGRPMSITV